MLDRIVEGDEVEDRVWHYIQQNALVKEGQTVGVAVSGGADSMALLVCLRTLGALHGFQIAALHYEHGIRGEESRRDARFVETFCEQNSIPFLMACGDVPRLAREQGIGLELAARKARQTFFEDTVSSGHADVVATAHHSGDVAESVLLHILRGCGTQGLRGIRLRKGSLIRPFLCVSREEIRSYLCTRNIPWVEDSTNYDENYRRNYVRRTLLPSIEAHLNPAAEDALCRLAAAADADAACLDEIARDAFSRCARRDAQGAVRIDRAQLSSLPDAISSRVLRNALEAAGRVQDVEYIHLCGIKRLAAEGRTGAQADLGKGLRVRCEYETLVLVCDEKRPEPFHCTIRSSGKTILPNGASISMEVCPGRQPDTLGGMREYMDADKLTGPLVLRTRLPGDTIVPLNGPGRKKLKDYFIDKKLPRVIRDETPLLAAGSNVLWIVGHILSQDACVDSRTTRVVRATYEPPRDW